MKFYQDVTLLPDPETDLYFLWHKVYQQVHLALVENKDVNNRGGIGLSWPNYQYSQSIKHLGNKLRIFALTETELAALNIEKWLERLMDYVHITSIRTVPDKVSEYACFSRSVFKSSKQRIARRKAKRENIVVEQALEQLSQVKEQYTDLPFIWVNSLSSERKFPLFIARTMVQHPFVDSFSCYGLSRTATVPWF